MVEMIAAPPHPGTCGVEGAALKAWVHSSPFALRVEVLRGLSQGAQPSPHISTGSEEGPLALLASWNRLAGFSQRVARTHGGSLNFPGCKSWERGSEDQLGVASPRVLPLTWNSLAETHTHTHTTAPTLHLPTSPKKGEPIALIQIQS